MIVRPPAVTFSVFLIVKQGKRLKRKDAPVPPPGERACPFFLSSVPLSQTAAHIALLNGRHKGVGLTYRQVARQGFIHEERRHHASQKNASVPAGRARAGLPVGV
ncbi:MAG TPA: hypothetical protein PLO63_10910, partial [Syntrophales bacterium]|nr:hypothetical protein [Syntrophales bacterium]